MKNFPGIFIFQLVSVLLLSLAFYGEVLSFQSTFVPVNESRLWIEGSSNVNEFECQVEEYAGEATLPEIGNSDSGSPQPSATTASSQLLSIKVDIQVDSIECGKRKMNKDLQEALNAEKYPEISFLFKEANLISEPQNLNEGFQLEVHGLLTISGTTKEVSFITEAYYTDPKKVRARGGTTINMRDFGVEPPTALMGLIRANEELTVNFDLIARPKNI